MDTNRTVSDTKRNFYKYHQRPINSIYRRVVEELMVEMHLLSVNVDFRPDAIYYLGVCESFTQFMNGYEPESHKESIFKALCQSIEGNPDEYQQKSAQMLELASGKSAEELVAWLVNPTSQEAFEAIAADWQATLENPKFKYSRQFAIGLFTLIQKSNAEIVKDEAKLIELIQSLSDKLNLPVEKLKKDLELYRSNLEKMNQMLKMLADVLEASKKKQQKDLEKQETENNSSNTTSDSDNSDSEETE